MERKRTKLAQAAPAEVPLTECTADPTEDSTTDKVSHCPDIREKKCNHIFISATVLYMFTTCSMLVEGIAGRVLLCTHVSVLLESLVSLASSSEAFNIPIA